MCPGPDRITTTDPLVFSKSHFNTGSFGYVTLLCPYLCRNLRPGPDSFDTTDPLFFSKSYFNTGCFGCVTLLCPYLCRIVSPGPDRFETTDPLFFSKSYFNTGSFGCVTLLRPYLCRILSPGPGHFETTDPLVFSNSRINTGSFRVWRYFTPGVRPPTRQFIRNQSLPGGSFELQNTRDIYRFGRTVCTGDSRKSLVVTELFFGYCILDRISLKTTTKSFGFRL